MKGWFQYWLFVGSKWFIHHSQHYLPARLVFPPSRLFNSLAIFYHYFVLNWNTNCFKMRSSSSVHDLLEKDVFLLFRFHLYKHWLSVHPGTKSAISFQSWILRVWQDFSLLRQYFRTAYSNSLISAGVQFFFWLLVLIVNGSYLASLSILSLLKI